MGFEPVDEEEDMLDGDLVELDGLGAMGGEFNDAAGDSMATAETMDEAAEEAGENVEEAAMDVDPTTPNKEEEVKPLLDEDYGFDEL